MKNNVFDFGERLKVSVSFAERTSESDLKYIEAVLHDALYGCVVEGGELDGTESYMPISSLDQKAG